MAERLKLYKSNLSETELKERITFLIQEHAQTGLKGYLSKFNYRRSPKIFGKIEGDEFWIWQQGLFSGSLFYPIFHGKILDAAPPLRLEMNGKPNALGGLLFLFVSFVLAVALAVALLYFRPYDSLTGKAISLGVALLLFLALQSIPNITYTISKRSFRQFLEKKLELERIN